MIIEDKVEAPEWPEDVLDAADFTDRVIGAYNDGTAEKILPADILTARSLMPAGTGILRDFSYIAPDIPLFDAEKCVGCMECVTQCPDTAILGTVIEEDALEAELAAIEDPGQRERYRSHFTRTSKYYEVPRKRGEKGGLFGIFVDPTKCKGCAECVSACGDHDALAMIQKDSENLPLYRKTFNFYKKLPETPSQYIQEKVLSDMMLAHRSILFVGGAGSCMGCGEATAIRMVLAATGFVHGAENIGIVAATGCNTVYSSTYPYNPFMVPWTNSLFENVAADAMGVRARWDQLGWQKKRIWTIGGDGAMLDIGFQSLSRMLASGMDIKVLVLDTQVYSNTGGQASTSSFIGQDSKMAAFGKTLHGKSERRKEMGPLAMMHPDVFVAQTTAAHVNHFYRAVIAANEYPGPAVIVVYTTCQPEHGVADNLAAQQAKLAVDSRAYPIFIHDPRKGEKLSERLSLQGNPAIKEDWYRHPKTGEPVDFIHWARTEGRFAKHFGKDGSPSEDLLKAQADRLHNWRLLQELAGVI
ncbi:MAG: 4Fe-4S binding protein [Armatimonadetes bacterium]|nr:4Fe-4S binding protein [Armatimonadota bacterium]